MVPIILVGASQLRCCPGGAFQAAVTICLQSHGLRPLFPCPFQFPACCFEDKRPQAEFGELCERVSTLATEMKASCGAQDCMWEHELLDAVLERWQPNSVWEAGKSLDLAFAPQMLREARHIYGHDLRRLRRHLTFR